LKMVWGLEMKVLLIHAEDFSYDARSKALKEAEEDIEGRRHIRVQNALVVFIAVEKCDCNASWEHFSNVAQDICHHAHNVKAENIVLYPYAHLSSKLARARCALSVLKELEIALRDVCNNTVNIIRAPFGWYKAFKITCYGHPLSELSREYGMSGTPSSLKPSELIKQLDCNIILKENSNSRILEPGTTEYANIVNLIEQLMNPTKSTLNRNYADKIRLIINKFGIFAPYFIGKGEVVITEIRKLNEKIAQQICGATLSKVTSLRGYIATREMLGTDLHGLCSSVYLGMKKSGVIDYAENRALLTEVTWVGNTTHGKREDPLYSDTTPVFIQAFHDALEALGSAINLTSTIAKVLTQSMNISKLTATVIGKKNIVRDVVDKLKLVRVVGVACNVSEEFLEITLATKLGRAYIPLTSVSILFSEGSLPAAVASTLTGPFLRLIYVIFDNALQMKDSGKTPYIPTCITPVQVRIIPVKCEHRDHAEKVYNKLISAGIRADIDARDTSLGKRIRDAGKEWIPYVVVIGDREVISGMINVRMRVEGVQRSMSVDDLVRIIKATCPYIYE